jgi:hypothetical protein
MFSAQGPVFGIQMKKGKAMKGQKKNNQGAYPCAMKIENKRV